MNLIALMPPLSLIKRLKMYLQATFVFFCATSVVQIIFFINTNFMIGNLFVLLYLLYCFKYTFKKAYKYIFLNLT